MSEDPRYRHLPPAARSLARCVGWPAFERLVEASAGRAIYVPATPIPGHELERLVGPDAFERLVAGYGPGYVTPPRCQGLLRLAREQYVTARTADGASAAEIARELGIWTISVHRIRGRARADATTPTPQLDLFAPPASRHGE